jgi:XRE family transcriptional regulator, regulator of sulfur utilization
MGRGVNPALGTAVRELRIENDLSQTELATRSSVHVTVISSIERGQRNPVWATVEALVDGLGISFAELGRKIDAHRR